MIMASPTPPEIVRAYRNLYRGVLHAIQYAKPGRYVARNQIRRAFRTGESSEFDQAKIDRTLKFLGYAAKENGLEHKILKNLLFTEFSHARNHPTYARSVS